MTLKTALMGSEDYLGMDLACAVGLERRSAFVWVVRVHLGHHYHTDNQMTNLGGIRAETQYPGGGRPDPCRLLCTIFLATGGRKTSDFALPIMLPLVILDEVGKPMVRSDADRERSASAFACFPIDSSRSEPYIRCVAWENISLRRADRSLGPDDTGQQGKKSHTRPLMVVRWSHVQTQRIGRKRWSRVGCSKTRWRMGPVWDNQLGVNQCLNFTKVLSRPGCILI